MNLYIGQRFSDKKQMINGIKAYAVQECFTTRTYRPTTQYLRVGCKDLDAGCSWGITGTPVQEGDGPWIVKVSRSQHACPRLPTKNNASLSMALMVERYRERVEIGSFPNRRVCGACSQVTIEGVRSA